MTFDRRVRVPVISSVSSLQIRIDYRLVTFTFADLSLVPRQIITGNWNVTRETLMWSVLKWGLPAEQYAMLDDMPMSSIRDQLSWWEEQSGVTLDEVASVITTTREHRSELEYDLLLAGMRLRDFPSERHNWRDLLVFIKHAGVHTRIFAASNPVAAGWDRRNFLLADIADDLDWIVWSRTEEAANGGDPPARRPRPGVKPKVDSQFDKATKVKPMSIDRAKEVMPLKTDGKALYQMFRNK